MTETTKPELTRSTETVWTYQDNRILVYSGNGKYYIPLGTTDAATLAALSEAIDEALTQMEPTEA